MSTAMRQRRHKDENNNNNNHHDQLELPLHRKPARDGADIRPYDPTAKHRRKRMRWAQTCVTYLSYAILLLTVLLVLVLRFDTKDRVRHRVVNFKNRVLGNTADYESIPDIETFFSQYIAKTKKNAGTSDATEGPVNGNHVVFCTVSNLDDTYVGRGTSSASPQAALRLAQTQLPRKSTKYPYVKIDVVTGVKRYEDFNYYNEFSDLPGKWFGLALNWDTDWVFHPEEVKHNSLIDTNQFIRWERLALYAAKSGRSEGALALPDYGDDGTTLDYVDLFHTESIMITTTPTTSNTLTTSNNNNNNNNVNNENHANQIQTVRLFHGHRMYSTESITKGLLMDRARAAGVYMAQIVKDTGRQVYRYNPRSDYEPFGYSLSRHALTLYGMTQLYPHWQDSYLEQSMTLTVKYLRETIAPDCPLYEKNPNNNDSKMKKFHCVIDLESKDKKKVIKLGVNALTILAIVEYVAVARPHDGREWIQIAQSMASFLTSSMQRTGEEGSFISKLYLSDDHSTIHEAPATKNRDADRGDEDPVSGEERGDSGRKDWNRYAHSQAAFALARLASRTHNDAEMKTNNDNNARAALAATTLLVHQDAMEADDSLLDWDMWLLLVIAELVTSTTAMTGEAHVAYMAHVRRATQVAAKFQNAATQQDDEDDLDRLGIFYDDESSAATAMKSQGLCTILPLLIKAKEKNKSNQDGAEEVDLHQLAQDTIVMAMRYQLQTQFQPEVALYMRHPTRVLGGFHYSTTSMEMRNDYTHFNLMSMLCLAKTL